MKVSFKIAAHAALDVIRAFHEYADEYYNGVTSTSDGEVTFVTCGGARYIVNPNKHSLVFVGPRASLAQGCSFGGIFRDEDGRYWVTGKSYSLPVILVSCQSSAPAWVPSWMTADPFCAGWVISDYIESEHKNSALEAEAMYWERYVAA